MCLGEGVLTPLVGGLHVVCILPLTVVAWVESLSSTSSGILKFIISLLMKVVQYRQHASITPH